VSHPAVAEAAAIGAPHPVKGETMVIFVVLRPGQSPSPELAEAIRATVVETLGPTLKPESIVFISQLARTRNGKILRRLMRQSYLGLPMGDLSALENPAALEEIAAHARDATRQEQTP
jgi:acetyl-CoA synthetase